MVKKILFLDLDGTLLNDLKEITPKNREALDLMLQRGHGVVITTGRPLPSAIKQAKRLGLDASGCYLVAYNGGVIYDWSIKQPIFSKSISFQDTFYIFDKARDAGVHIQTYDDWDVLVEDRCENELLEQYIQNTEMTYRRIDDIRKNLRQRPIKCLAIEWENQGKLRSLQNQIHAERSGRLDAFFSCDAYLEIVSVGINKGAAVQMLCRQLNHPIEDTVAVGDAANDISMLQVAGVGVAMCNATDELKAVADATTRYNNNQDGVSEVIARYFT